jgi:hypothetical protein
VICNDLSCDQPVSTGNSGEFRFFTFATGFGIAATANSGEFYTDAMGKMRVSAGQSGAVRQYVTPGLAISLPRLSDLDVYYALGPWGAPYVLTQNGSPVDSDMNLEGALGNSN